jgi:hypothetical protein
VFTGNLTVDTNTLFVDATNNKVGIGTSNPAYKLEVAGDVLIANTNKIGFRYSSNDNNFYNYLSAPTNGPITLAGGLWTGNDGIEGIRFETKTAGSAKMSILNNGNVGIGTTNPTAKLGVNGTAKFNGNVTVNAGNLLVGTDTDNGVDRLQVNGSISANSIKIPYADRVRITGRERCFKILSFASYYAGSTTSEAFIIDILDADYYDGISYRKILINRTGIIKSAFFAGIDYSDSYAINLKTYNDNGVISLYLYTANYCDSCVLDFAYNRLNTTVNATSVGTNEFVPAGTLISSLL